MNNKISLLGINNINALTKEQIINILLDFSEKKGAKTVFYLNTHCINVAYRDEDYRSILNRADLVYTGGQGVVWAARFLGCPLPERVNILDFFDMLTQELKDRKITIYLLGGTQETVKKTEDVLKNKGLRIVGSRNGFFDETEEAEVICGINVIKPDILMVGMGVPKQEKWIFAHLKELDVHLCWAVGAAFDWLSGQRKRAPRWMIQFGLEWLHRLCQQPKRLWKRYLLGNLIFVYRVIKYGFKRI